MPGMVSDVTLGDLLLLIISDLDAPTLHIQALNPPQAGEYQARCFFLIRPFSKDIQDSGTTHYWPHDYLT